MEEEIRKNQAMRQKFINEIDGYFKRKGDAAFDRKFLSLLEWEFHSFSIIPRDLTVQITVL